MPTRDVLVIGASAGGVEALRALVSELPADLPAAVLIVLHVPATGHSALPRILERRGSLPCKHAEDGEPPFEVEGPTMLLPASDRARASWSCFQEAPLSVPLAW